MKSHLLTVYLSAYTIDVLFRKPSPVPRYSRLFSISSSIRISISGFIFEVFDPLRLEFCARFYKWINLHSYTCRPPVRSVPCVEDVPAKQARRTGDWIENMGLLFSGCQVKQARLTRINIIYFLSYMQLYGGMNVEEEV